MESVTFFFFLFKIIIFMYLELSMDQHSSPKHFLRGKHAAQSKVTISFFFNYNAIQLEM